MKKPLILGKIVCLKILKLFYQMVHLIKIGKVEPHGAQVYKKDKKIFIIEIHFTLERKHI